MKNNTEKEIVLTLFHQLRKLNSIQTKLYKKHQEYAELCNDVGKLLISYAPHKPDQLIVDTQTDEIMAVIAVTVYDPELMDLIPQFGYQAVEVYALNAEGDYLKTKYGGCYINNKQIKHWRALTPDEVYQFRKALPQKGPKKPRRTKEK